MRNEGGLTDKECIVMYIYVFRSNAIYGKSSTVQPPAVTVRYLIKAA